MRFSIKEKMEKRKKDLQILELKAQEERAKRKLFIFIDPPHGDNVPGKGSPPALYPTQYPDETHLAIREYKFVREKILPLLVEKLIMLGYEIGTTNPTNQEYLDSKGKPLLSKRVDKVKNHPTTKRKVLISSHINAKGMGNRWQTLTNNKNFYCVFTSKGQTDSDILAEFLYEELTKSLPNLKGIKDKVDGDNDLEANFTVILDKSYNSILIEFGFQDIKEHVELLLTDRIIEGYVNSIIQAIERFNSWCNEK